VTRTLRPQLWTLLALAILCRVLREPNRRTRRWLPVLFAIWANAHGGWVVGLGVFAVWTAVEAAVERHVRGESLLVLAAAAIATLATPYGLTLWVFLATTVSLNGRAITEWQPLWNSPPADAVPWVIALGFLLYLARWRARDEWPVLGVLAMLAYASLKVVRIVPLYVLCSGLLLSRALSDRWPVAAGPPPRASRAEWRLAVVLTVAASVAAIWLLGSSVRCVAVEGDWVPDAVAAGRLKGARTGRLVTFFDWGQYAIWHLAPTLRVSMDGRRETIYSDARLAEHGAILEGTRDGLALLEEWAPEYVWLPASSSVTREWLRQRGYRLDHASERSFVAVRPDLPVLPASSGSIASCFPG
jgi:hypothetical protein